MSDPTLGPGAEAAEGEETLLDASKLEEQWHEYAELFERLLRDGEREELRRTAAALSPGDLSESLRYLGVDDTARVLQLLPPDLVADVLAEIDQYSVSALLQLLDIEAIADLIEEMPSDEAADFVGELEDDQAREILAAMEPAERQDVADLLRYEPDTAGGLMAKEFIAVSQDATIMQAVDAVRAVEADDREGLHFVFVVDGDGCPTGRIPLVTMLLQPWSTPVAGIMERDPLRVSVDLDQEDVAQYVQTHDLVTLPVVDDAGRLVGVIQADDVIDVLEEEATEDYSRLAGTSEELGEKSPVRVARARLPWLLGALAGEMATMQIMKHYQATITTTVALTFFLPAIMAMGGNTGIQTSSVVVRGLATGEVSIYRIGRYLMRELGTALLTGTLISACVLVAARLLLGRHGGGGRADHRHDDRDPQRGDDRHDHPAAALPGRRGPGHRHRAVHHHVERLHRRDDLPGHGLPAHPLTGGRRDGPAATRRPLPGRGAAGLAQRRDQRGRLAADRGARLRAGHRQGGAPGSLPAAAPGAPGPARATWSSAGAPRSRAAVPQGRQPPARSPARRTTASSAPPTRSRRWSWPTAAVPAASAKRVYSGFAAAIWRCYHRRRRGTRPRFFTPSRPRCWNCRGSRPSCRPAPPAAAAWMRPAAASARPPGAPSARRAPTRPNARSPPRPSRRCGRWAARRRSGSSRRTARETGILLHRFLTYHLPEYRLPASLDLLRAARSADAAAAAAKDDEPC